MRAFWFSGLLAIGALAFTTGCGDDETPTNGGTADTTPPAISSVTPVDGFHLDVLFDEDVQKESAERRVNYVITEQGPPPLRGDGGAAPAVPGDTVEVVGVSLNPDKSTVSITTSDFMDNLSYSARISGVKDLHGNKMVTADVQPFVGTGTADGTAPTIVFRSPGPGATGVGTGQPVIVQFSETMWYNTITDGFTWTSSGGSVPYEVQSEDALTFAFQPLQTLTTGTTYTVTLTGAQDLAFNTMATASWSFTTTPTADTTPPTLVSTTPADGTTNVSVNTLLSLTFSEAVNQSALDVLIVPNPGDGTLTWSNGGKTITFEPDQPLTDNTQYALTIFPGGVMDLAGNGNPDLENVVWTTGSSLDNGRFSGTISGDSNSDYADDPTGAFVIAAYPLPFDADDFGIYGSGLVGGSDTYMISNLPDGVYYPVCAMDSNDDGAIEPDQGDAIGAYGIDLSGGDFAPDSVTINGGNLVSGVDFPLFDQSAIVGTFSYSGGELTSHYFYVGAFDTMAFDPTSDPAYGTREYDIDDPRWTINTLDDNLQDGVYYVGAFLDVNDDEMYDPTSEPAGFYGGAVPTPIVIERGGDALNVHIVLVDPGPTVEAQPVPWRWTEGEKAPWIRRLGDAIRRAAR
jgi:hypothetical protein